MKYGASPGIYTQFAGEYFKLKTGTDILFVPYKGGAPAVTDALGGHIEMVVNNKSNLLPQFKDGKLKALAVTSQKRWPELPQTPTMREVGISGFPQEVLFGLLAPAGTPEKIVMQLNGAVNEALQSTEVRASLDGIGVDAQDRDAARVRHRPRRAGPRLEAGDRGDRHPGGVTFQEVAAIGSTSPAVITNPRYPLAATSSQI